MLFSPGGFAFRAPPEPAAAFFRSEAVRMAQVAKNANVKID